MDISEINAFVVLLLTFLDWTNFLIKAEVTKQESQQNLYSLLPQTYYIPQTYSKYVSPSNQKYITQTENQIPVTISSTEKAYFSPSYKVGLDASKYSVQPTQINYSNQDSYPYLYTIAKVVSPTTATYAPTVVTSATNYNDEVPKKYHYGYRVSDAHTGTEFGHSEVHDGHSARGYYHVLLPDGRLQNVKYWAGPSGYHATITYESKY